MKRCEKKKKQTVRKPSHITRTCEYNRIWPHRIWSAGNGEMVTFGRCVLERKHEDGIMCWSPPHYCFISSLNKPFRLIRDTFRFFSYSFPVDCRMPDERASSLDMFLLFFSPYQEHKGTPTSSRILLPFADTGSISSAFTAVFSPRRRRFILEKCG